MEAEVGWIPGSLCQAPTACLLIPTLLRASCIREAPTGYLKPRVLVSLDILTFQTVLERGKGSVACGNVRARTFDSSLGDSVLPDLVFSHTQAYSCPELGGFAVSLDI